MQGKRLEALPLLEELAGENPKDDEVVVALAASLVEHAATLTDQQAAGKELLRARGLLERAREMGNISPLAQNLLQLLQQMPENGSIKFSDNPQAQQVIQEGEAAFSRRDFDAALKDYARALQIEPSSYPATLFTANTYDRKNDFANAATWYGKAILLDPNVETAYRYYADMLAKQGDMKQARSMLIHAAVAEPYNKMVWRELNAWATINNTKLNFLLVGVPISKSDQKLVGLKPSSLPPEELWRAWQAYYTVKENWKKEGEFRKRYPKEAAYRRSLAEESEALTAAAKSLQNLRESEKTAGLLAGDPSANLLLKLYEAGMVEPYVLFSLGDEGIARDYSKYRAENRGKLEEYMDKFVVPPVTM